MPISVTEISVISGTRTVGVSVTSPQVGEVFQMQFVGGGTIASFTATNTVIADILSGLEAAAQAEMAASSDGYWDEVYSAGVILTQLIIDFPDSLVLTASSGGGDSMATIDFQNGTDGLFDLLEPVMELQSAFDVDASERRTAFDALVAAIGTELTDAAWVSAIARAESAMAAEESTASEMQLALQAMAQQIVINVVDAAVDLPSRTLDAALRELCSQMIEEDESFTAPAVGVVVAADGGNTGDCFLVSTKFRTDGAENAFLLAEVIDVAATLQANSNFVRLLVTSDAISASLSPLGLGGSGLANQSVMYFGPSSGLLGTGSPYAFTTSDSTLPGSWIANVGTLGTAIKSGQPQTDTITVSGTPTAGTFRVQCATSSLGTQSTVSLPYNATGAQIQAAIAAMTGFSSVSISSSGTGPDYTHTIKFYGMREAVTTSVVNSTNTGSFSVATPTAYAIPSLGSSPLVLISDGSTLVSVSHLVNLVPRAAYAVNAWLAVNTAAASGVVEIALTNGVGGSVIQDDAGNDLKYTVNASSLGTGYLAAAKLTSGVPIFMTPASLPASVYLRIRASTTLPSTRQLYVDNVVIGLATKLYAGGPFMAAFCGPTGPKDGDYWTITTTNDHAGTTSFMFERNFSLRSRELWIPHSGTPTIDEITLAT